MTGPLAIINSKSQDRLPPHDNDNDVPTRKLPVTVPSEQYSTSTHLVSNMPDVNTSNCLFDPPCLSSPLQTLVQTLESNSNGCITTVDVAHAYQTLYNRLRASATVFQGSEENSRLKSQIPILVQCLKRDINEGLKFFSPAHSASLGRPSSTDASVSGMLEDPEIQMSIDSSLLCQSALRVVSALMMIPGIYTHLPYVETASLLHPIIEICVERHLSIFDHRKIHHLAFSCMRADVACQSLSRSQEVAMVEAVSTALDLHEPMDTQMSALKTAQAFLHHDASRFIESFSSTLPKVLSLLPTSSSTYRVEVVNILCGFATARCQVLASQLDAVTSISADVHEFFKKHKSRKRSVGEEHLLPGILKEAIKGDGAVWALTSVAALVILGDAHIFSHPRSLKVVFDALRYSSRHKTPAVASLHTEVWKCLVWALSRSFAVQDEAHFEARKDTYQRAFQMLAQEMRPSVGTRLVAVLMQDHSPANGQSLRAWNVQQAVAIIKQLMGDTSSENFREGYTLLYRLMGGVSSPDSAGSEPRLSDFIRDSLVNGSCLRMSLPDLEETLKVPHSFPLSCIHPLTEAEVRAHWQDLSESWAMAAERFHRTLPTEALGQLTGIWQSLLLSQAHLTQGQTHLAASSPFATKFATLITRFVSPAAEPDERSQQLGLVRKWWNVLKNVFDPPWLSVPAGIVLTGLLEKKLDLRVEKVQDIWSKLCFELISTGIPTFLHLLHTRVVSRSLESEEGAPEGAIETRLLWALYVRHCVRVGCDQSWTELAALLSLPFHCDSWTLNTKELNIWSQGFAVMLPAAERDGIDELKATRHMIEHLDDHKRDSIIITLFEVVAVDPSKLSICRQTTQLLNDRLSEWYLARNTAPVLRAMSALGQFWKIEQPSELTSSVSLAQNGISLWISDPKDCASNADHAEMTKAVFIPALECLTACHSTCPDILTVLESLFISVFAKPSTLGADAFLAFFRTHYQGLPNLSALCPERLFTAAKGYADFCNEPLEGDISILTPSSPSTIISDSQSLVRPRKRSLRHEYSHFEESQDMIGYGFQLGDSRRGTQSQSGSSRVPMTPVAPTRGGRSKGPFSTQGAPQADTLKTAHGTTAPSPGVFTDSPEMPIAPSRRAPKRHHTEGYLVSAMENRTIESLRPLKRTKTMSGPLASPTTSNLLSLPYRSHTGQHGAQAPLTGNSLPPSSDPELEPQDEEEDDYDSWEAGISHKDIQALRDELDLEREEDGDGASNDIVVEGLSPSPSDKFPFRSRRRERSQTAPEPSPQPPLLNEELFARGALRRHRTSGSFDYDDNTQLKAVRHAYAAVVDSGGVSQMGMEELMQMKRLASRIGQTVDEHIEEQWEKKGRLGAGKDKGNVSGQDRSRSP